MRTRYFDEAQTPPAQPDAAAAGRSRAKRVEWTVTVIPPADKRDDVKATFDLVESLMGRKPELRFEFIQKNAKFARDLDV